ISKVILSKGWRCLDCTVCEGCAQRHDEGRLILCDECDISYHIYCTDPPLDHIPRGTWKCKWCAQCLTCGATDWEGLCENGTRQSPVDLSRRNALPSASIEPIAFIHYGRPVSTNITNNGHTVVLKLDQNEKEIGIAAGGLYNYYILDSIHLYLYSPIFHS
ncbi:PHD finger protein 14-like, partial [Diaphorina citri]|uniref:PHD finger protein 14-like n=1 Tax=Diaphorina citri TaxID=121845 RepID=A0A3Q0JIF5_DIACI